MALKFLQVEKLLEGFNNGVGWVWKKKLLFLLILSGFIWLGLISIHCHSPKSKISDFCSEKVENFHENYNAYKNQAHERIIPNQKEEVIIECGTKQDVCPVKENIGTLDGYGDEYMEANSQCFEKDISMSPLQTSKEPSSKCFFMWWFKYFSAFVVGLMMAPMLSYLFQRLWAKPNQELALQGNSGPRSQLQSGNETSSIEKRPSGRWFRIQLYILLLVGVFASIMVYCYISSNEVSMRRELLAEMCDRRARMLQDKFDVSHMRVRALAILVSQFYHEMQPSIMDHEMFAEYTGKTTFDRPLTSGVAYAKRVLHSERKEFEEKHGWTIKKMHSGNQSTAEDYLPENLDSAPIQEEYAPVIFTQDTVSHIISIDMMSGKEDRENVLRARASGMGVLTSPFPLLKSNHLGVILTYAVYDRNLPADATAEQRIAATEGYLGASFDISSMIDNLMQQLTSTEAIFVNVYDITSSSESINMYGPNDTDTGDCHVSKLDFGDLIRKHEMRCSFKEKPLFPVLATTASFVILVITFLVSYIWFVAINKLAKIENECHEAMVLKVRAEAADLSKSQILATVSHEIRTPIIGIRGMLRMLLDDALSTVQVDFVNTASDSGECLLALINDVLDLAKIEAGRLVLEAVQFDIRLVLDNALSFISAKFHDKGIELAVYVSDMVPLVLLGDPMRFYQIVLNLIRNSIEFTVEGHIFVSVHLVYEVTNLIGVQDVILKQQMELVEEWDDLSYPSLSGYPVVPRLNSWKNFTNFSSETSPDEAKTIKLLVSVEDTGAGIPQSAQDRMFEPFMQVDGSTARRHGGTGIGLSISKHLVAMMGGEIGFSSEPSRGSTFTFTATFDTEGEQTPILSTNPHKYVPPPPQYRGMKVLVVDVISTRAQVTKYHLKRLGISVEITTSLEAAKFCLSYAYGSSAKTCFDMVLIEENIVSNETSFVSCGSLKDLCKRGGRNPVRPKIILLSNSSVDMSHELKSLHRVDEVMFKPLRLDAMCTCFNRAFGKRNRTQTVTRKPTNLLTILSGKQILVVDDNIVNRKVASGALSKYGAEVIPIGSGKVAVEMLTPPHKFHACFMDIQMPEMDGFEATELIRKFENEINEKIKVGEVSVEKFGNVANWHIPIIAMTADWMQAIQEKCIKCGMDDHVSKPFVEEQLYSAVIRSCGFPE